MKLLTNQSNTKLIATFMMAFKLVRAFTGILTTILAAKYFGAGVDRDAYLLASAVVIILTQGLFGPINDTIRTKFIYIKNLQGDKDALKATSSLLTWVILVSLLLIILFVIKADIMSKIFAPGFKLPSEQITTIKMIRYIIPTIVINETSTIMISILNCYNLFFLPEILYFITSIVNILLIVLFVDKLGINVLILSSYVGLVILIISLFIYFRKSEIKIAIRITHIKELLPFLLFALPFYVSYITSQISNSIEKAITTQLGVGNISLLDYSRKFADVPISTFITVTSTVLTPILVQKWINQSLSDQKNKREFQHEIRGFIGLCILILIPIVVAMTICGPDLIHVLLVRGNFKESYIKPVASLTFYFGLSMYGLLLYIVIGQVLVAQQKVRFFAFFSIAVQLVHIVLNYAFYETLGIQIFAISSLVSHFFISLFLIIFLNLFNKNDYFYLAKYVLLTVISLSTAFFVKSIIPLQSHFLALVIPVAASVIVLLPLSLIFGIDEVNFLKKIFNKLSYA